MDIADVADCFQSLDYAADLTSLGYRNSWYDVEDDPIWGVQRTFTFEIPAVAGDLFISVDSYYMDMTPRGCHLDASAAAYPVLDLVVYLNDQVVASETGLAEPLGYYALLEEQEGDYQAGDIVTV